MNSKEFSLPVTTNALGIGHLLSTLQNNSSHGATSTTFQASMVQQPCPKQPNQQSTFRLDNHATVTDTNASIRHVPIPPKQPPAPMQPQQLSARGRMPKVPTKEATSHRSRPNSLLHEVLTNIRSTHTVPFVIPKVPKVLTNIPKKTDPPMLKPIGNKSSLPASILKTPQPKPVPPKTPTFLGFRQKDQRLRTPGRSTQLPNRQLGFTAGPQFISPPAAKPTPAKTRAKTTQNATPQTASRTPARKCAIKTRNAYIEDDETNSSYEEPLRRSRHVLSSSIHQPKTPSRLDSERNDDLTKDLLSLDGISFSGKQRRQTPARTPANGRSVTKAPGITPTDIIEVLRKVRAAHTPAPTPSNASRMATPARSSRKRIITETAEIGTPRKMNVTDLANMKIEMEKAAKEATKMAKYCTDFAEQMTKLAAQVGNFMQQEVDNCQPKN